MNHTVIEAHARYLIQDRVNTTRRTPSGGPRRRHRFPRLSWL